MSALLAAVFVSFRSRASLQLEILALRHQLGALPRSVKRPKLTGGGSLVKRVLDDKEAVQQLKCQRRHSEEIEGDDDLPVVLEKSQPPIPRVTSLSNSKQIPGNSLFRDNEPEFPQLAVDLCGLEV